jgi:hypothetical protein
MSPFALFSLRRASALAVTFFLFSVAGLKNSSNRILVAATPSARFRLARAGLPLSFEPNLGQADQRVKFISRGRGYTLLLTKDEAVLAMQKAEGRSQKSVVEGRPLSVVRGQLGGGRNSKIEIRNSAAQRRLRIQESEVRSQKSEAGNHFAPPSVMRLKLMGANTAAKVVGRDELEGKSNYFVGRDPKQWHTNLPTYARVRYQNVYPGVDLVYYGNQGGQLEWDFVIAPGADPSAIALSIVEAGQQSSRQKAEGRKQKAVGAWLQSQTDSRQLSTDHEQLTSSDSRFKISTVPMLNSKNV